MLLSFTISPFSQPRYARDPKKGVKPLLAFSWWPAENTTLTVDASPYALGAILSNVEKDGQRNRLPTPIAQNYVTHPEPCSERKIFKKRPPDKSTNILPSRPLHSRNVLPSSEWSFWWRQFIREDIFCVWRHDFLVLRDVHLQRVYLQEESLPCFLSAIELSAWPLFIGVDQDKFGAVF